MLEIRKLTKIHPGPVAALESVDLTIGEGMFGLLGPNGAGKTTLMRILAGVLEPTTGQVRLDGEDVLARPETVWSKLGYLPQSFGFYPHLSGEEMLVHLLRLKGVGPGGGRRGLRRLAGELLERVHLGEAARRQVGTYSGGMRQRLGIAQAIAGDPRLVIVDEPTAGLDPEERLRFYRLLSELAAGRIVLLSTHIVDDVAVLCPRFAVLRGGRIVAETTPGESRRRLAGRLFEGEVAADALEEVAARHEVTRAFLVEGRHRVRVFQPDAEAPLAFEPVAPSLEDAYLLLMRHGELPCANDEPGAVRRAS